MAHTCPECGSEEVTVAHIQLFMANGGDHYCHSVKTQDSDSPAGCLDCNWSGERGQLVEINGRPAPKEAP